ncbi:MAG: hypothetical protein JW769_02195 [Parachlamydiales bacterium]|nr:hypothetical protein [Parachlamydiales bacterium]
MDHEKTSPIFRKSALKKLYSPEQLDTLLHVVKPKAWIALIVLSFIIVFGVLWALFGTINTLAVGEGIYLDFTRFHHISSPIEGDILRIPVTLGDRVDKGQVIAVLWDKNASKETEIRTPYAGLVIDIYQGKGNRATVDAVIASLQLGRKEEGEDRFYCFLPPKLGDQVKEGMSVRVYPWGIARGLYGGIEAVVEKISYLPATESYFKSIYLNQTYIEHMIANTPLLPVIVRPVPSSIAADEFLWTSGKGPKKEEIPLGSFVTLEVIIEQRHPFSYLLPFWADRNDALSHDIKVK